jgi:CubicO group peptidase (beta-lactamase class C family)
MDMNFNQFTEMNFKIGEVAAMFEISTKTLRIYDRLGLLKPSCINGERGYRYYSPDQIRRLEVILNLKKVGFSLKEINSFGGAGGMYSTAADLCKWDEALYTEKLLSNDLLKEAFKPVLSGYAMGWYINGTKAKHGGDAPGYSTSIMRMSSRKLLILLLCNLLFNNG